MDNGIIQNMANLDNNKRKTPIILAMNDLAEEKMKDFDENFDNKKQRIRNQIQENEKLLIYLILNNGEKIFFNKFDIVNYEFLCIDGIDEKENRVHCMVNMNEINIIFKVINKEDSPIDTTLIK